MRSRCCARAASGHATAATAEKRDELAPPHCRSRSVRTGPSYWIKTAALEGAFLCPLWVKKQTFPLQKGISALPPKAGIVSETTANKKPRAFQRFAEGLLATNPN